MEGTEIKEFVKTAVQSIEAGLAEVNAKPVGLIHFELGVVKTRSAKGGFKILVADASGKLSEKSITTIKFDAGKKGGLSIGELKNSHELKLKQKLNIKGLT